jgi:hypothetical protein
VGIRPASRTVAAVLLLQRRLTHARWRAQPELIQARWVARTAPARPAAAALLSAALPTCARWHSQPQLGEARVIVWPAPERPVEQPPALIDRKVVDARVANRHEAVRGKLPVLVAVRAEPVVAGVSILVCIPAAVAAGSFMRDYIVNCNARRDTRTSSPSSWC